MYREWKKIEFLKCIIYEFGNNRLRGRPKNSWQGEVKGG
jgi:hypothetical protein